MNSALGGWGKIVYRCSVINYKDIETLRCGKEYMFVFSGVGAAFD